MEDEEIREEQTKPLKKFDSVTTIIKRCFTPFDKYKHAKNARFWGEDPNHKYYPILKYVFPEKRVSFIILLWDFNGANSRKQGIALHNMMENYFKKQEVILPKPLFTNVFENEEINEVVASISNISKVTISCASSFILQDKLKNYFIIPPILKTTFSVPNTDVSTEFHIFREWFIQSGYTVHEIELEVICESINIKGRVDCILKDKDNDYHLIDWKRSKKNFFEEWEKHLLLPRAKSPFSKLPDCGLGEYCAQLNLYCSILEQKYSIPIKSIKLIRFFREDFEIFEVPKLKLKLKI